MSKLKANRKEEITPFNITVKDETWTIVSKWVNSDGEAVWYDGEIYRGSAKYYYIFSPEEVEHDQKD